MSLTNCVKSGIMYNVKIYTKHSADSWGAFFMPTIDARAKTTRKGVNSCPQLMQGDCLELLKKIPDKSIDLVVTDPPYGINYQSNIRNVKFAKIENDKNINACFLDECKRVLKSDGAIYCFTRWDVYPEWAAEFNKRFKIKNCIVWYKKGGGLGDLKKGYIYNHEFIIYSANDKHRLRGKRTSDVFEFKKVPPALYVHPTQKPVELLCEIINKSTDVGAVVLDPFMGSGTTGVACVNTGRKFIGIELDEQYFEIAEQRINNAVFSFSE